jgi:hypothetical protein
MLFWVAAHRENIFLMNSAISLSVLEQYRISPAFVQYRSYIHNPMLGGHRQRGGGFYCRKGLKRGAIAYRNQRNIEKRQRHN